jgi:hypothetical protein
MARLGSAGRRPGSPLIEVNPTCRKRLSTEIHDEGGPDRPRTSPLAPAPYTNPY